MFSGIEKNRLVIRWISGLSGFLRVIIVVILHVIYVFMCVCVLCVCVFRGLLDESSYPQGEYASQDILIILRSLGISLSRSLALSL